MDNLGNRISSIILRAAASDDDDPWMDDHQTMGISDRIPNIIKRSVEK